MATKEPITKKEEEAVDAVKGSKAKEAELRVELAQAVEEAEAVVKGGNLKDAIDGLLKFEKKARLAMINTVTKDAALEVLRLCYESGNWDLYCSSITLLSKRRQQHSSVVAASVKAAMLLIEKTPDEKTKTTFLETVREVTEGKIFLEVERARLTRKLAGMKEKSGNIDEASTIMQEVQVETFGTMDNAEKVEFILEQIRLCIVQKDWVRVQIIQKKIDRKAIDAEDMQALKLRFYRLVSTLHAQKDETIELARAFLSVLNTKSVQNREADWKRALGRAAIFIVVSAHGKDQSDLLHRTQRMEKEKLKQTPQFDALLKLFTTQEIIAWPLNSDIQKAILSMMSDKQDAYLWGASTQTTIDRLRRRVLEHNVRVISTYYARIRLPRLAELIGLDGPKTEQLVCDMVSSVDEDENSDPLFAKIDRPTGIVSFERPESANVQMTQWATNISNVLDLVEKTRHLIDRENMVANAAQATK